MRVPRFAASLAICLLFAVSAASQLARTPLEQPTDPNRILYPADANANADIKKALLQATREQKRVLVEFGANWCFDCHVLDRAFHSKDIAPVVEANFVVVHVDVGRYDKNMELAKKYEVPLEKGVPALAVLDASGKLLFSQKKGEFEAARRMTAEEVLVFLNQWKPDR